jgi:hypothetical protein
MYGILETIVSKGPELTKILFDSNVIECMMNSYPDLTYRDRRNVGGLLISVVLNRDDKQLMNMLHSHQNLFEIWFDLLDGEVGDFPLRVVLAVETFCERIQLSQAWGLVKERLITAGGLKVLSEIPRGQQVIVRFGLGPSENSQSLNIVL